MQINGIQYGPLQAKVTRACKTKDAKKIVAVAREVIVFFDKHGWPDGWPMWRNKLTDALDGAFSDERWTIEELFS